MAKITLPSYIKEGRGRMDDAVLTKWKGITYMKPYRKPSGMSENQLLVRKAFTSLVADWRCLSGIIRIGWEASVAGLDMTGYNAFIGANMNRRRAGEPLELSKKMGEEQLMNFSATAGSTPGDILCSYQPAPEGRHITFFARKQTGIDEESAITRHDAGSGTVTSFLISGLEPGYSYHIFAVVTDLQYQEAATVSASVSTETLSGS